MFYVWDPGLIPGSGTYPEGQPYNPPQYAWLENPTAREAWRATVHRVAQSQPELSDLASRLGYPAT